MISDNEVARLGNRFVRLRVQKTLGITFWQYLHHPAAYDHLIDRRCDVQGNPLPQALQLNNKKPALTVHR